MIRNTSSVMNATSLTKERTQQRNARIGVVNITAAI